MTNGSLLLVLHAHLPWVRQPARGPTEIEELWLFEALSECYLPLLELLERRVAVDCPCRPALSLSMPLVAMLDDAALGARFEAWLDTRLTLARTQLERAQREEPELAAPTAFYAHRLEAQQALWPALRAGGLVDRFAALAKADAIELFTCVGTHGLMPLMATHGARRGQLRSALRAFRARTGITARSIWLPECAFTPGVERLLADEGIAATFVSTASFAAARTAPRHAHFAPLLSPAGTAFFARDPEASEQVWSAETGYPADPAYRDFYRDVGFDRPIEEVRAAIGPEDLRLLTGIKLHRITQAGQDHKEPWDPALAAARARSHGADFVRRRREALALAADAGCAAPVSCTPFDAELFGHWWFEGPFFLEALLEEAAAQGLAVEGPAAWMEANPIQEEGVPATGTWGDGGQFQVWVNHASADILLWLQQGEHRMQRLANRHRNTEDPELRRALNAAAVELMLAQASDWTFILYHDTAVTYARRRLETHLRTLDRLLELLEAGASAEAAALAAEREGEVPVLRSARFEDWV